MKIEVERELPFTPPIEKVIIELSQSEAEMLRADIGPKMIGNCGSLGALYDGLRDEGVKEYGK